ncbi:TPA: AMP-binding protein, partial [Streptococcus suis]
DELIKGNIDLNLKNNVYFKGKTKTDIAYILHTSGSTGKPKGVKVSIENLNYITDNMQKITPCNENSIILFMTPYTFDVSITEICGWVYEGGAVICRDIKSERWFNDLQTTFENYKITHIAACPSVFATMINILSNNNHVFDSVKFVVLAGERFLVNIHKIWKQNSWKFRLFNAYGPTEATVYSTIFELSKNSLYDEIPIGNTLTGVDYIIEEKTSELLIGGEGVTKGYTEENLTKKSFIEINQRVYYKTGDLVELKDKLLFFRGRNDNQIQINGMRIELGEIESKIEEIDVVQQAKVIYHENKIIAFIKTECLERDFYNNKFKTNFEPHLVPNIYFLLNEFPLTPSNKVDKKMLINKYLTMESSNNEFTQLELEIKNLFLEILEIGKDNLSKTANFFELGGDSLRSVLFLIELEKRYELTCLLSDIYNNPTIESLSTFIENKILNKSKQSIKTNNIELLTYNLENEFELVNKYVEREGDLKDIYEVLHLQRVYYYDKFESYIEFDYTFSEDVTEEKALDIANKLIATIGLFRTVYLEENGKLYFVEKAMKEVQKLPIFEVSFPNENSLNDIIDDVKSILINHREEQGLLNCIFLYRSNNTLTLYGIMDHAISDGSTPSTIREMISKLLRGDSLNINNTYRDYISLVKKHNEIENIINNSYYKNLIESEKESYDVLFNLPTENSIYNVDIESNVNYYSSEDINLFISYNLGQSLLTLLNREKIVIKYLANGKDYLQSGFKYVIGDFHTSIYSLVYKDESFENFLKREKKYLELYYKKQVFRPSFSYGSNYPIKNKIQREIKKKLKHTTTTSVDFLGTISEFELKKIHASIIESLNQLSKIDDTLYLTVYMVNKKLIIYSNKNLQKIDFFNNKINK